MTYIVKLFIKPGAFNHLYFDEAHDAAVDVRACADCFFELREIGVIGLWGVSGVLSAWC